MSETAVVLPAVGVCGFGRCGSTMTMAALAAGGVPPIVGADPHSFEMPDHRAITSAQPEDLAGHSIKLLDAIKYPNVMPSAESWRFIWIDRNHQQIARSQIKLLRGMARLSGRADRYALAEGLDRDRSRLISALSALGPVLVLRYEDAIAQPLQFGSALAEFLEPAGFDFAPIAASVVVHDRDPRCTGDLAFEVSAGGTWIS